MELTWSPEHTKEDYQGLGLNVVVDSYVDTSTQGLLACI